MYRYVLKKVFNRTLIDIKMFIIINDILCDRNKEIN